MRKNCQTRIIGNRVILVPYRKIHVPKYHHWMQSPNLQELTASEPLTEEEEYQMQQSWLLDENKCTFIVLDRQIFEGSSDEVGSMIGDTNLYLVEIDGILTAETGIMVAEESVRGQGKGKEAMCIMLRYGVDDLNVQKFIAKISFSNENSIKMFKKFGFEVESESSIFEEVTLFVDVTPKWVDWLKHETEHMRKELDINTNSIASN